MPNQEKEKMKITDVDIILRTSHKNIKQSLIDKVDLSETELQMIDLIYRQHKTHSETHEILLNKNIINIEFRQFEKMFRAMREKIYKVFQYDDMANLIMYREKHGNKLDDFILAIISRLHK